MSKIKVFITLMRISCTNKTRLIASIARIELTHFFPARCDKEEEGQSIPMQDSIEKPQESQASSPSGFKEVLMDPLPGVLSPMFKK